jgi:hypothetical protein
MPNRLPSCAACGPRYRHLPKNCPVARKSEIDAPRGILFIPNGIPALIASFRLARKAIDDILKELGA